MPVRIERLSPNDAMVLATDRGPAPMNMGALLVLDAAGPASGADFTAVRAVLAQRAASVPRLGQVLRRAPPGCGRPYWVDDPGFDPATRITAQVVAPEGTKALLRCLADLVTTPLERSRPLWAARWVTGWDAADAARPALVVVLHHLLADGIGGLGVLAALADLRGPADPHRQPASGPPAPAPRARELARDAMSGRWAAVRRAPQSLRRTVRGARELGLGRPPQLVARTSLNRPTGRRRRVTTVDVPLSEVAAAGRRLGGTVNDVVLAAVVGALTELLRRRGEHPEALVVSVPVSARPPSTRAATTDPVALGNHTGVLPVRIPTGLDPPARLGAVSAATAALRDGPRGTSAAPLGAVFRALDALGVFRYFVEHQRLVHTFESNLRGPSTSLRLAGHPVRTVVPMAANPGNVGVSFLALSYAGRLVVSLVADPFVVPDQEALTDLLAGELAHLAAAAARPGDIPGRGSSGAGADPT